MSSFSNKKKKKKTKQKILFSFCTRSLCCSYVKHACFILSLYYTTLDSTPLHSRRILQFKLNATAATTGEDVHPTVPHTNIHTCKQTESAHKHVSYSTQTQEWPDKIKSTRFMGVRCTDMQLNTRLFIHAALQSLFSVQVSTRIKSYFMRAAITVKENLWVFLRKGKFMMGNNQIMFPYLLSNNFVSDIEATC